MKDERARMEATDDQLYARMRSGDRRALGELYERREPALYRYALHMSGNEAMAEEAAHEAFLSLIREDARFDPERGSVQGYLYGVVRNHVRSAQRSQAQDFKSEPAAESDLAMDLVRDEAVAALHFALRSIPDPYREAVVLCDLQEMSYEEAAAVLGCPVGTVRSRLHRGRTLLAERMRSAGWISTGTGAMR